MDALTLSVAKSYTNETVIGGGAIKGKNCTIKSIEDITGGQRITFSWELDDGTKKTSTIDVMNGQNGSKGKDGTDGKDGVDGVGIASMSASGNILTITYTDGNSDTIEIPAVETTHLDDLLDVTLNNPSNNQVLKYDSSTSKWKNADESGGGGGGSNPYDYSETEKVVGTWIDGTSVYQRTYTGTLPASGTGWLKFLDLDSSFDKLINYEMVAILPSYGQFPLPYKTDATFKIQNLAAYVTLGSDFKGKNYRLTLRYTKVVGE
jgi:hypothetical protein